MSRKRNRESGGNGTFNRSELGRLKSSNNFHVYIYLFIFIENLESLKEAFKVLESITANNEILNHIRSRIEQIIDLRNRSWKEADPPRNQTLQVKFLTPLAADDK